MWDGLDVSNWFETIATLKVDMPLFLIQVDADDVDILLPDIREDLVLISRMSSIFYYLLKIHTTFVLIQVNTHVLI